ncbi:MAG: pyridoxal phosphate-dependent aminotransferase family protein [Atribacterota bacterium]|jgi:glycine C-acetyltransferase|nr:pyridoxal phosphate-dependent aminotransferase family protein [Atribacterota bacterium]
MDSYKIDLQENKKSKDGSILGKVNDFQSQLKEHENQRLNILKKSPLSSACDRIIRLRDRFNNNAEIKALMFGSNSYLGIITKTNTVNKAIEVTKKFGIGAGGVPLLSGTNIFQNELESTIADLKGFDDAIIFSSGFTANIGAIIGLVRSNNLIIHDKLNHASLIDGSLMSGAKMLRYQHNDPASLDKILQENYKLYPNGILVVTDGVFSMDGDIVNLPAIINIVNKYNAVLLIDDAHSTGVIGDRGRGSLSHYNISQRDNIVVTGTLSKAIGTVGGFITANQKIIDYLRIFARSNMYSTALPPSVCASSTEVINYMKTSDVVYKLKKNSEYMKNRLSSLGYNTLNSETAIIPIIIKDEYKLTQISKYFFDKGIVTNYIYPPVVSPNKSRIRISMMATHTKEDMDYFITILEEVDSLFGIK